MEEPVVATPRPSEAHSSAFANRPSYKWWDGANNLAAGAGTLACGIPVGHSWDTL